MKEQCTLTDKELWEKVLTWVKKLAETGGRAWSLRVPIDFDTDPDMLICELVKRFQSQSQEVRQPLGELEIMETCRQYAESKMASKDWDRKDHIQIGAFYSQFIARMLIFLRQSPAPSISPDEKTGVYDSGERTFTQSEIERLQSEIHKITGNGEVMVLFNKLLGVSAG
jgi:hypothetical protein